MAKGWIDHISDDKSFLLTFNTNQQNIIFIIK